MLFRDSVSLGLISELSIANLVISDVGGLLGRSPLAMEYLSPQDAGTLQQCCWDVIFSADINGTSGIPRTIAPDKQCRLDS